MAISVQQRTRRFCSDVEIENIRRKTITLTKERTVSLKLEKYLNQPTQLSFLNWRLPDFDLRVRTVFVQTTKRKKNNEATVNKWILVDRERVTVVRLLALEKR
ncbi:hypothetical protein Tsp_09999 [Trichinella spiralis]|uniref:hypothetical protein n=1 Tax=Trichinella spiralis TaxID=6334 RepID=UPI0001EFE3BC|nr:hypothetical protein Tsp_09999 [Trichinella spiralis]